MGRLEGVLGVLLAGGRGERLGAGVPKALAGLGGATLLERALEVLAFAEWVVVVAPASIALPALAGSGAAARRHDPGLGPLGGARVGLAEPGWTRAVVLGVDFPAVEPAALRALVDRLDGVPAAHVAVPVVDGEPQPLAAAYARAAVAPLEAAWARGERSIARAIASLPGPRIDADTLAGGAAAFLNVNTLADLDAAERALAARREGAA